VSAGETINDDAIDEFIRTIQPRTFTTEQAATYFAVALGITLLPTYIYYSIYDLFSTGPAFFYLLVVLGSSSLLTLAYRNVESTTYGLLEHTRKFAGVINYKKLKLSKEKAEKLQDEVTAQESLMWTFFRNNSVFVAAFLFMAFYVLRQVDTGYNFVISLVLASAVTWQLSNSTTK